MASATNTRLCSLCAGVNFEGLAAPDGYQHQPTLSALVTSSSNCSLCNLIHSELKDRKGVSQRWLNVWKSNELWSRINLTLGIKFSAERDDLSYLTIRAHSTDESHTADLPWWVYDRYDGDETIMPLRTKKSDPAVNWGIRVRNLLPQSTNSTASFETAQHWLEDCMQNHSDSNIYGHDAGIDPRDLKNKPTRLVQVDETFSNVRIVEGSSVVTPYAALSYVWGRGDAPWRTLRANIQSRRSGFAFNDLPQTLRDAAVVAVRLGISHVWIDALCIVQDDIADWEKESVMMNAVYSNAIVTIVASCSTSSTSGLFNSMSQSGDSFEQRGLKLQSTLATGEPSTLYISPSPLHPQELDFTFDAAREGPDIFERGWTFQEWLMSPRKLYMTSLQLMWECGGGVQTEDGLWTYQRPSRGLTQQFWLTLKLMALKPSNQIATTSHTNRLWYKDIECQSYSGRNLTNFSDRLIAVSGVAKLFKQASKLHYLAGTWLESLPGGLCWRSMAAAARSRPDYIAPSWSWASFDSAVEYLEDALEADSSHDACEIINAWVKTRSGDEMGTVIDGELTLSAPVLTGDIGSMITEAGTYEVDESPPEEPVFYPDILKERRPNQFANVIQGLSLDEDIPRTGRATAIVVHRNRKTWRWGMVVAKHDAVTNKYQRIGFIWVTIPWLSYVPLEIPVACVTII